MSGHGEKLTRKQEDALAALLSEPTIEAAATKAGVAYSTLRRWLQGEDFLSAYRAARRQVVEAAVAQLQLGTADAVATLRRNLTCGKPAAEIRAAEVMLNAALRGIEWLDLEERMSAQERLEREREDAA